MISRRSLAALLVLVVGATTAEAQFVEVRLRDETTRELVSGAIVRLLSDTGAVVVGLTDEQGRITLRAPGPGSYRIRADRIGFAGYLSDPLALVAGQVIRTDITMSSTRIVLPTLVVHGETQCGDRGGGPVAAALWEEIRKALTANLLTQQAAVPLRVQTFERDLSRTNQVLREHVARSEIVRGQPFASLPPDYLAREGFVVQTGEDAVFAGIDAELLLSGAFVDTHCFLAVQGADDLVGLAFEPIPRRGVPDVKGALWVDPTSNELRYLEFTYTGLRSELVQARLGGRVEFERLPTGEWIVSYWHIRMPVMGIQSLRTRRRSLSGYRDQGGRAEIARTAAPRRAVVTGRVLDSLTGRGLAEAMVRVSGQPEFALTDADGHFRFSVSVGGDRRVTATHHLLGLVPDASSRDVLISLGDTTAIELAGPSIDAFVRTFCGVAEGKSGLVGLTMGEDGDAAEGLEIRVRWLPPVGAPRDERMRSGPRGIFALCDLPPNQPLPIQLHSGRQLLAELEVRLEPGQFRWMELGPPTRNQGVAERE